MFASDSKSRRTKEQCKLRDLDLSLHPVAGSYKSRCIVLNCLTAAGCSFLSPLSNLLRFRKSGNACKDFATRKVADRLWRAEGEILGLILGMAGVQSTTTAERVSENKIPALAVGIAAPECDTGSYWSKEKREKSRLPECDLQTQLRERVQLCPR
jgi:hypothetical protein